MSWEYPPILVGGLGRHVADLAGALAEAGHDVRVLTRGGDEHPHLDQTAGVAIARAARDPIALDFGTESLLAWVATMEHTLIRAADELLAGWRPDVVHGHDWLVAQTVRTLSQRWSCPTVITMHATEHGRQQGWLGQPLPRAIHSLERWVCRDAAAVITCSNFMASQVQELFGLPPARVHVIGNGVHLDGPPPAAAIAAAFGGAQQTDQAGPGHPLLVFAGRLVHEKGLQELIKALPAIAAAHPGVRLAVAGSGPQLADQQDRATRYGVAARISWRGRLDRGPLAALMVAADVVVVPSLYEPFGLVALEAQALGTPVAVSETGGLIDLVKPSETGELFTPQSPSALAEAVLRLLADPQRATEMADRAREQARSGYSWPVLAARTAAVYGAVGRRRGQDPSAQRPSANTV